MLGNIRRGAVMTSSRIFGCNSSTPFSIIVKSPMSTHIEVAKMALTEPTFQSLGLGVHSTILPQGFLQTAMETVHISIGLPWWQTIIATTVCIRICVFPVVVSTQRNILRITKHQPKVDELRNIALSRTDPIERDIAVREMMTYMRTHQILPHKLYAPMLTNGIVMASMFFALRGMSYCPVESMEIGGILWFADLCTKDPTYTLPILTSGTLLLQIWMGADGMNPNLAGAKALKYFMYSLPFLSLPVMIQFPSALNLYWLTSNVISLIQSTLLKNKHVKKALQIQAAASK